MPRLLPKFLRESGPIRWVRMRTQIFLKIYDLQQMVGQLQQRLRELDNLKTVDQRLEDARAEIGGLHRDLERVERVIPIADSARTTLEEIIQTLGLVTAHQSDLESFDQNAGQRLEAMEARLGNGSFERIVGSVETLERQLAQTWDQLAAVNEMRAVAGSLEEDLDETRRELGELKLELAQRENREGDIRAKVQALTHSIESSERQAEDFKDRLGSMRRDEEGMQRQINELRERQSSLHRDTGGLQRQLDETNNRVSQNRTDTDAAHRQLAETFQRFNSLRTDAEGLQRQLNELRERQSAQHKDNMAVSEQIGKLRQSSETLLQEVTELRPLGKSFKELNDRTESMRNDEQGLQRQISEVSQRLSKLHQSFEQQEAARTDLKRHLDQIDKRCDELKTQVPASLAGDVTQLRNQVSGIREQMEKDRPVFNRLRDSWLHPDYYYRNVAGLMEDRQRLLYKAIELLEPGSRVLDIGPGNCFAMEAFQANGHKPVGLGLELESYVPREIAERHQLIEGDYNTYKFDEKFDAIWASHVLEHQPDKNRFVRKMFKDLKDDGWLFVLVPPMKAEVVGGHLNLFNCGYLLYTLIVGGFDCSEARVTKYGYNIVVYVRKKGFKMPKLRMDEGDIETLAPYFPFEATQNFNGLHLEINWKW